MKRLGLVLLIAIAAVSVLMNCKSNDKEIIQLPDGTSYTVTYQSIGDSIRVGRYENGTLYYKSLKYNGLSGASEIESFTYYPNGDIRKYAFFLNDSLRYYRFYSGKGQFTESGGCGLAYLDNDVLYIDTVVTNEPYFQQLRLVSPPNCKVRVLYGDEVDDEETRDFTTHPLQFLPVKGNYSGMLVKFDLEGQFRKVLYWSIEDTVNGGIEKGRIWRHFVAKND
ncbi:MAG: hypothetical protein QM786_09725 [Breznakibacter sp.]